MLISQCAMCHAHTLSTHHTTVIYTTAPVSQEFHVHVHLFVCPSRSIGTPRRFLRKFGKRSDYLGPFSDKIRKHGNGQVVTIVLKVMFRKQGNGRVVTIASRTHVYGKCLSQKPAATPLCP